MKKLLILTFLGLQSLSAYTHPEVGSFAVQGEFLYFLPTVEDTFYALRDPAPFGTNSNKRNNDYDFTPGYRIEASYGFCGDAELIVRYSNLHSSAYDEIRVQGDDAIRAINTNLLEASDFSFASSQLSLRYQNVDALYGMRLWNGCKFNFKIQGGLEYASIKQNETSTYSLPFYSTVYEEKTWGIGPQLGINFDYQLFNLSCRCPGTLSFVSRASSSLLVSETTYKDNEVNIDSFFGDRFFNVQDDAAWRIVPAWHARFGLNYEACFSCMNASFEIGYEFNQYLRAISRELFMTSAGVTGSMQARSNYNDFGMNGLYVALGLGF